MAVEKPQRVNGISRDFCYEMVKVWKLLADEYELGIIQEITYISKIYLVSKCILLFSYFIAFEKPLNFNTFENPFICHILQ